MAPPGGPVRPMRRLPILSTILVLLFAGCAQSGDIFPDPGQNIATPNAMAVEVAANRLYLVNSNAEVLYDWHYGSFQVLDITDPLAPTLLKSTETPSFSGQVYVDPGMGKAFVPNRFSESADEDQDSLFVFNVDETSPTFMTYQSDPVGRDAYAIACCYPANRAFITTSLGELQYVDLTNVGAPGVITLTTDLDTGGNLSHAEVNHIALKGTQAFLSREYGGVLVVNLDDAGIAGANAVDYYISDIPNPRGIAWDGTYIYVVAEGNEGDDWRKFVAVLDPSTLVPIPDNTTTRQIDKDDAGILVAIIDVGDYPQEIQISSAYAFVTNQDGDTVSVIDRATLTKIADIAVGDEPFSLALYTTAADGDRYLYIGNVESNTISIIDIPSLTVVATYP
jgi:YVTN family beta-propeller protein